MRAAVVIPARYASSRFPGKPLADIAGKTMIQRVYERAAGARLAECVLVATDDERIRAAVAAFGGRVVMTRADHPTGTDRIAEAVADLEAEVIANVQGDEPLLDPAEVDAVLEPLLADPTLVMSTMASPIVDPRDTADPGVVKVVTDRRGRALYFSRHAIPYYRAGEGPHLKHFGLYAYRREFLLRYAALAPTPLEQAEALEQLRALEHGYAIHVVVSPHDSVSVDTPADLERVRELVRQVEG